MALQSVDESEPTAQGSGDRLSGVSLRFLEFWNSRRVGMAVLLVCLVAALLCCAARAYVGLYGMVLYTHDTFAFLDGAWRLMNGQLPHINFYTGLGPVMYLQTAAGLALAHGRAEGFGYAQGM